LTACGGIHGPTSAYWIWPCYTKRVPTLVGTRSIFNLTIMIYVCLQLKIISRQDSRIILAIFFISIALFLYLSLSLSLFEKACGLCPFYVLYTHHVTIYRYISIYIRYIYIYIYIYIYYIYDILLSLHMFKIAYAVCYPINKKAYGLRPLCISRYITKHWTRPCPNQSQTG
jgi:hypothetical protein